MHFVVRAPKRRTASLALVAGLAVVSVPPAVRHSWNRLAEVWTLRGETIDDARRRVYGDAYWNGIEALRAAIPKDGAYFMAARTDGDGKENWVRFDLAPRRPWLVERVDHGMPVRLVPVRPAGGPEEVVAVRNADRPPVLLDADAFWGGAPALHTEREDYGIPANVDAPAEGARVRGRLLVQGWCQEQGGKPCADVKFYIDAELRVPATLERFARRDVEAAVPGIGDCASAGYRAAFEGVDPGSHALWVFFRTGDGRYRRLGPRKFVVER